jgi:hypothetical protein
MFSLSILFIILGVLITIITYRNTRLNHIIFNAPSKLTNDIEKEDIFSIEKKLLELKTLRDKELITEDEYKDLRKKVLDSKNS